MAHVVQPLVDDRVERRASLQAVRHDHVLVVREQLGDDVGVEDVVVPDDPEPLGPGRERVLDQLVALVGDVGARIPGEPRSFRQLQVQHRDGEVRIAGSALPRRRRPCRDRGRPASSGTGASSPATVRAPSVPLSALIASVIRPGSRCSSACSIPSRSQASCSSGVITPPPVRARRFSSRDPGRLRRERRSRDTCRL